MPTANNRATFSSPSTGPRPCTAAGPPELSRSHRPAGNSQRSPPTFGPPPARCHSAYARSRFYFCPPDDSGCSPAVPETIRNSNTTKSRETTAAPATTLQCHMSSPTIPHVSRAQCHRAIVQPKLLQDRFRVPRELLVLFVGILRSRKLHQLHFLKLVLAYDPAHILPIRSRLAAKARCVRRK